MVNAAKFDRALVVEKAMQLFWQKGFHATSMRHLQAHVDLRPGSIYATFGSKEGLFTETLQHYGASAIDALDTQVSNQASPLQALKAFIYDMVIEQAEASPSRVCMLVKTISELTEENACLLAEAQQQLKSIEDRFGYVLQYAKDAGELPVHADTAELAPYIQMQIMGLRAYAGTCDDKTRLERMIDQVFIQLSR